MIDWTQAYGVDWRLVEVNVDTWASGSTVPFVQSVSISRDCTDDYPLLETATLEKTSDEEYFKPGYYRLEAVFDQNGLKERQAIMTMICESDSGKRNHGRIDLEVDGLSVLQPAKDHHLLAGEYVPKGANAPQRAADYLRRCVKAPVRVEGSFIIDDYLVLDADISYIKAAWIILDAADWCMQIEGDGTIVIKDKPKDPTLLLDRAHAKIVMPELTFDNDLSEVPNMYIAVDQGVTAIARNDDPDSRTSIPYRGRIVDEIDRSPVRINGETLDAYARRMLEKKSTIVKTRRYNREWWPEVYPFSIVRGTLSTEGLVGDMRVLTQSFKFGNGILVSETAGIVDKEYIA